MITINGTAKTISDLDRAPQTRIVEAVLRKTLKISDPTNVDELSRALLLRYSKDALLIDREKKGLPFSVVADQIASTVVTTGNQAQILDAQRDLERVLKEIAEAPAYAEIGAEMRGWARAIRAASADGLNSARFALDPHQSDRALAARRTLGDYARVSRYAAALTTCDGAAFCRLAQCCDTIASLILVLMGDALSDAGVTRSSLIPRVPGSVLRERRDTVLNELRSLHRSAASSHSPEGWPRATVVLTQIYQQLETSDTADLRSLLDENYLSRQLDDLLDLVNNASPDGLKELGSVAMLSVRRFNRFIAVTTANVKPPSPPLARFTAALLLFVQGFAESAGGYRLPFLARSPLLVGQASITGGSDVPTLDLIRIALARSAAAEWIDCLCCSCEEDAAKKIILFTKVIYDLDRTIDLYSFGTDPNGKGDAEIRAGAFGALLEFAAPAIALGSPRFAMAINAVTTLAQPLLQWRTLLDADDDEDEEERRAKLMHDMLCLQLREETGSARLVSSITPICRRDLILAVMNGEGIADIIDKAQQAIVDTADIDKPDCPPVGVTIPADLETAVNWIADDEDGIRVEIINPDDHD